MHHANVLADRTFKGKTNHKTRGYTNARNYKTLGKNFGENAARLSAQGLADSELTRAPAHGKGEHARHSHHGDQQCQCGKSAEYDGVETVRCENFRAHIFQRGGPLHRLVCRNLADCPGDSRNQCIRVILGAHKKTAAPAFLV